MNSIKRGFTLVELLVVMAVLVILMGAATVSVAAANKRARIQKATSDVKVISQAILAYENFDKGNEDFELPVINDKPADASSLAFLIGEGGSDRTGGKLPVLLMASLSAGRTLIDPWGTPYRIKITETSVTPKFRTANGQMQTGFYLPNFYRLSEGERK